MAIRTRKRAPQRYPQRSAKANQPQDLTDGTRTVDPLWLQRAVQSPRAAALTPNLVQTLQRRYGNRSVERLVQQAKERTREGVVSRQPAQAPAAEGAPPATGEKLQAKRFQGDSILEMVMDGLLTLKKGSRGPRTDKAVQKVQRGLIDSGVTLSNFGPDGIFGSETEASVKDFQAHKGLPIDQQDGKVGPITLGLLDAHYSSGGKPRPLPPEANAEGVTFALQPPVKPRYASPDPFVDIRGDALRLDGPQYSFLAMVNVSGNDAKEAEKWDVGHVQDVIDTEIEGAYTDKHKMKFEAPLPIRDAATEGADLLFPWYRASFIRPVSLGASVGAPHTDTPGAQFPMQDGGATLKTIRMRFKAVDWITARNRNTGHIRFLHHAKWGFDYQVTFDPSKMPTLPGGSDGGIVITQLPTFPDPVGQNDEIEHGPGKGAHEPAMTEGVFNDEAKLVKS